MITGLPENYVEVISANDNLERYLLNLTQDVPFTKRSWLYENREPSDILLDWKNHLKQLETGSTFEQEVYQFDISSEEKWGPQGGHAPISDLLDEIILPTFQDTEPYPTAFGCSRKHRYDAQWYYAKRDWTDAIRETIEQFHKNQVSSVRPATLNSVIDDMRARDTLESNSGWPDFARRNLPEVKRNAVESAQDGSYTNYPAIALLRTYRGKTRLVWMFPMATNLIEGTYYQPLQNAVINAHIDFYAPWQGFEHVRKLISDAYDSGKYIAASDFSSTDAHFKLATSVQAYWVLSELFKNSRWKTGLWSSLVNMHTIPLLIGIDQMITGDHGVSSGSNWTNFIETVFDNVFANYVAAKTNYRGFYAIGDDMAWIADSYSDEFSSELEALGKTVGQIIKPEKTTNDRDKVKTLQRLFQRGYRRPDGLTRGVYPTIRALNSSVFPERFHKSSLWSSDMFCARQYMILENCVDHPLFEEFVKFVVQGQRDLIPFAKKSGAELEQILRKSKLIPGLNPTYNQERRDSSLANFESIRIASKL